MTNKRIPIIPLALPDQYKANPLLNGEWKIGPFMTRKDLIERYGQDAFERARREALVFLRGRLEAAKGKAHPGQS